jgi:hypothetical protein
MIGLASPRRSPPAHHVDPPCHNPSSSFHSRGDSTPHREHLRSIHHHFHPPAPRHSGGPTPRLHQPPNSLPENVIAHRFPPDNSAVRKPLANNDQPPPGFGAASCSLIQFRRCCPSACRKKSHRSPGSVDKFVGRARLPGFPRTSCLDWSVRRTGSPEGFVAVGILRRPASRMKSFVGRVFLKRTS